jgi:alpha-tubulin suppressor-like RCC1 family protein
MWHLSKRPSILLAFLLAAAACEDPLSVEPSREHIDVATGGEHTCAIAVSGQAFCWGRGLDGELGTGDVEPSFRPLPVAGDVPFRSITAGDAHTCALSTDGRVLCWGWSAFFQTGNGESAMKRTPTPVLSERRFTALSAGAHHTCALAADGRVLCWGYNRWGQAGNGTSDVTALPIEILGDLRAVAISSGGDHSCALTEDGTAFCWGKNDAGQLGVASDVAFLAEPTPVVTELRFSAIDAGASHTCAIARGEAGEAYCWGSNGYGELGDGATWRPGLAGPAQPVPVILIDGLVSISAGTHHTCATDRTGLSWCWGRGAEGQLGNGNITDHAVRQPVYVQPTHRHQNDLVRFSVLSTGGATHACGIADRAVFCWGTGRAGQLGGEETFVTMPRRVED